MMMINSLSSIIICLLAVFVYPICSQQTQKFIARPSDTKVILGQDAVLRCSVSIRHGDVQWIHEGTALGYDRQIPGKPRYSVVWTESEDIEYHLSIKNVTLEDEGLFSCQVAPIGDWDTKLEAKARLNVLVPPKTSPEIAFNDESKNSGDMVKFRPASTKATKFNCTVRRSKPAAVIKWYLNDSLVNTSIGYAREVKFSDGLLEEVTSVLELRQHTHVFNNSMLKCQAFHESFGTNFQASNMSSTLRIVVVNPPGAPMISGYDSEAGVVAGSDLSMICSSQYTYPPAMLSWYRDNRVISKNYDTIEELKKTEAIYRIPKVSPGDNKALMRCDAYNQAVDAPLSSPGVTLNVWFGPEKLTISGNFEVEVNKSMQVHCSTDATNPASTVRFHFNDIDYEPTSIRAQWVNHNRGSTIMHATFTYPAIKHEHHNKEVKCYAENKYTNLKQIQTKQIKVLFPPDSVEIVHLYKANTSINEDTQVRLVCVSRGGNPLPEISWKIDGNNVTGVSKPNAMVNVIESILDFKLTRNLHQKVIHCNTSNRIGIRTANVSFNVSYLPSSVIIAVVHPNNLGNPVQQMQGLPTVKSGSTVIVSCRATNSNPEPIITWFRDGYPVLPNSEEKFNSSYEFVKNEYNGIGNLQFVATSSDHMKEIRCDVRVKGFARIMHGSLTIAVKFPPEIIKSPPSVIDVVENSTFSLNLSSRANPVPTYNCSASNKKIYPVINTTLSFIPTRNDNSDFTCVISNTENRANIFFKLNVKYSPTATINNTLHVATKGTSIQIFCVLDGNPLFPKDITWKSKDKPILSRENEQFYSVKFIPPNLSVLTIHATRDIDDGNVSCSIANGVGARADAYTQLRVKRAPLVLETESVLKAGEDSNIGRSARFKCTVSAYPDVTFKWKTPAHVDIVNSSRYVILNEKRLDQVFASTLFVYGVTSNDYGTYYCESRNEIGSLLIKAVLSGKHQPEQPSDFRVINITKNSISLAWKKNFDGGEPQKFRIRFRKDTMDPTYKYVETEDDTTSITLSPLETATRYVINIQSLNKFGTDGFLREPLIVQTDFGFNDVNQMPIFTGNDFPLTIILVICGSGTLFMLFNVAFIIYLIRKRKRKSEADSTTDTNETETNTVEMFSPPPPYPDELKYQIDLNTNNFEDENKPFVSNFDMNLENSKYYNYVPEQLDFAVEYATPVNQNWPKESKEIKNEIYLSSQKQLNKCGDELAASLYEINHKSVPRRPPAAQPDMLVATFGNSNTRPIPVSASLNQNLTQIASNMYNNSGADCDDTATTSCIDNHPMIYSYENANPICQQQQYHHLAQPNIYLSNRMSNMTTNGASILRSRNTSNSNINFSTSCKIYQDMDDYDKFIDDTLKLEPSSNFKGHLV